MKVGVEWKPVKSRLLKNFPNPFNPETWIAYQLAEDDEVTLTIYDMTGRVIRTIQVGYKPAAVYETRETAIYWDGRNNSGESAASGVYFYTLTTPTFAATRKMTVLK
jgi:flagellar hook assembly protein FlgD